MTVLVLKKIIQEAMSATRRTYPLLFLITFLSLSAGHFLDFLPGNYSGEYLRESPDGTLSIQNPWLFTLALALTLLTSTFVAVLNFIFLASAHQKTLCTWNIAWRLLSHVFMRALLTSLITWTGVVIGLSLFILPGFVIGTFFALALPIVIFEESSPWEALKKSAQRVYPNLLLVALIVCLSWSLLFGGLFLTQVCEEFFNLGNLSAEFLEILEGALILPFAQSLIISLYFSLQKGQISSPKTP